MKAQIVSALVSVLLIVWCERLSIDFYFQTLCIRSWAVAHTGTTFFYATLKFKMSFEMPRHLYGYGKGLFFFSLLVSFFLVLRFCVRALLKRLSLRIYRSNTRKHWFYQLLHSEVLSSRYKASVDFIQVKDRFFNHFRFSVMLKGKNHQTRIWNINCIWQPDRIPFSRHI